MKTMLQLLPKTSSEKMGWPWTEETDPNVYDKNTDYPKITIVTPSYNQGQYIEETIRSILLQNYPNLEYIIIDGGSTDESVEIIKKYEPWITYWISEKDRGQSHAINKGFEKATGTIVNWINSDDSLTSQALYTVSALLNEDSSYCLCGNAKMDYIPFEDRTTLFRTSLLDQNINLHLANCSYSQPATFFKFNAYKQITPLEETLHMNMDMYLWYRFVCLFGLDHVKVTDKILCHVKVHEDAKTVKNFKKSYLDKERVFQSLFTKLKAGTKSNVELLPIEISEEVIDKINYSSLKMYYFRTHFYDTDFTGKIIKIKFDHIFQFLYLYIRNHL